MDFLAVLCDFEAVKAAFLVKSFLLFSVFALPALAEDAKPYPWKIEEVKKVDGPLMRQRDVFVLIPHSATNAARLRLTAEEVFRDIKGNGFDSVFVFLFRKAPMGRELGSQASWHWTREKGVEFFDVHDSQMELERIWIAEQAEAEGANVEVP